MRGLGSLLLLVGSLSACAPSVRAPASEVSHFAQIRRLLERSSFRDLRQVPLSLRAPYDPVVYTTVASLRSRSPARNDADWKSYSLPSPTTGAYWKGSLELRYRAGDAGMPAYVVVPGSFATWKRGSFINQTVELLDTVHTKGRPHIVAVSGFFTPEFLKGRCDRIPWDGQALGSDFYGRLRPFLESKGIERAGAIGYSSGANVAIELLVADARESRPLFTAGAIASSPMVDMSASFANLDRAVATSSLPRHRGLTTMDPGNIWALVGNLGAPGWEQVAALRGSGLDDFRGRFANEFFAVDLSDLLKACRIARGALADLSFSDVFIRRGFASSEGGKLPEADVRAAFARATDFSRSVARTQQPLLLSFAQDDPVLSHFERGGRQPESISRALAAAAARPNVIVHNPELGGHTGLLLDAIYPALLRLFFAAD